MIPITIITCTSGDRPNLLERCIASVKDAMSSVDTHLIIHNNDYIKTKKELTNIKGFIAFVDDDDYIDKDSLTLSRKALEKYDVGLAFTYEKVQADPLSNFKFNDYINTGANTYSEICLSPRGAHHLAVFNTKYIHPDCFKLQEKFSCGIDWLLRATVALTAGCVKVPTIGYYWNQHFVQETKSDFVNKMIIAQPDINLFLESISKFKLNERIPVYLE